ncbi:MAG: hypothetical protein E6Q40_03270 [Cupriavidus sp.]|nr:MAG: hypothetical protein E6Q40_03270 [Cupriavidus sp.]
MKYLQVISHQLEQEKNMSRLTVMVVLMLLLGACSWMRPKPAQPAPPKPTVPAVIVLREPAPASANLPLYFGEADQVYLALDNSQYGTFNSIPGLHRFIISARGSANFELEVNIQPDTITCIKAYADPARTAESPPVNFTNIFRAEVVPCPPGNVPVGYKRVGTNS